MSDKFIPFTRETQNPYQGRDEAIIRPSLPLVYVDTRSHGWLVVWQGDGWAVSPMRAAAKAYGLPAMKLFARADNARLAVDAVEERLESMRIETRKRSRSMLWLLLLAAYALSRKGR